MRKIFFAALIILVFASFCYAAGDKISQGTTRGTAEFTSGDSYISYVAVSDSADLDDYPANIVVNNACFNIGVHHGSTQNYNRHYIVTDTTGTMVLYELFTSVETANTTTDFQICRALPNGDYTFTFVAAGSVSGMAVPDQVHFSVR